MAVHGSNTYGSAQRASVREITSCAAGCFALPTAHHQLGAKLATAQYLQRAVSVRCLGARSCGSHAPLASPGDTDKQSVFTPVWSRGRLKVSRQLLGLEGTISTVSWVDTVQGKLPRPASAQLVSKAFMSTTPTLHVGVSSSCSSSSEASLSLLDTLSQTQDAARGAEQLKSAGHPNSLSTSLSSVHGQHTI